MLGSTKYQELQNIMNVAYQLPSNYQVPPPYAPIENQGSTRIPMRYQKSHRVSHFQHHMGFQGGPIYHWKAVQAKAAKGFYNGAWK